MKFALALRSLLLLMSLVLSLVYRCRLLCRFVIWLTCAKIMPKMFVFVVMSFISVTRNFPVMCTQPISVPYRYGNKVITRVVPCGHCAECRSVQQASFAALTLMEAQTCTSFAFATLTYRDELLPWNLVDSEYSALVCGLSYDKGKPLGVIVSDVLGASGSFAPTLHREHLKAHLKRFRKKIGPERSKHFRYAFFGEYGSRHNRPHYHGLLFNLDPYEIDEFRKGWESYYGSAFIVPVPRFNPDGSDAFVKVSKYISKYIAKGSELPSFVRDGYAERPRRMCSRGYGLQNLDIEQLRNFI